MGDRSCLSSGGKGRSSGLSLCDLLLDLVHLLPAIDGP